MIDTVALSGVRRIQAVSSAKPAAKVKANIQFGSRPLCGESPCEVLRSQGFVTTWKRLSGILAANSRCNAKICALDDFMIQNGAYDAIRSHLLKLGLGQQHQTELRIFEPTVGAGRVTGFILAMLKDVPGNVIIVANDVTPFISRAKDNIRKQMRALGIRFDEDEHGFLSENRTVTFTSVDISDADYKAINGRITPPGTFDHLFDWYLWTTSFQYVSGRSDSFAQIPKRLADRGRFVIMDTFPAVQIPTKFVSSRDMKEVAAIAKPHDIDRSTVNWVERRWIAQGIDWPNNVTSFRTAEVMPSGVEMRALSFTIRKSV